MHPITYSLILNLATLAVAGVLAFAFASPWLVLVAILVQTHAIDRFRPDQRSNDSEEDEVSQPMGFTADVK